MAMNMPMMVANNSHYYIQLRRGGQTGNPFVHNPYGAYGYKPVRGIDVYPTPTGNNNAWMARDAVQSQTYVRQPGYPMPIIPAIYSRYGILDEITQLPRQL